MIPYTSARSMIRGELAVLLDSIEGIAFYERVVPAGVAMPYAAWKVVDGVSEPDSSREQGGVDITQCLAEITFEAQAGEIEDTTDTLLQAVRLALLGYRPSRKGGTVRYDAGAEAGVMLGLEYNSHHPRVEPSQGGITRCRLYVTFIARYSWQKVRV